jgi:hypothetical protein
LVKRSFKTPLQAIVASLEGMKIRKDRSLYSCRVLTQNVDSGEKDPVLGYEETKSQIHTTIELVTFPDGHMSHIENQEQLADELVSFFKKV